MATFQFFGGFQGNSGVANRAIDIVKNVLLLIYLVLLTQAM